MSTWGGPVDVILTGGRVVTPDGVLEHGWVSVRDGRIAAVGEGVAPDGPDDRRQRLHGRAGLRRHPLPRRRR